MPTGTMVSNNLNIELFKTNLREAWGLEQKEYPVMYTEAFHTESSRKKFEETLSMRRCSSTSSLLCRLFLNQRVL